MDFELIQLLKANTGRQDLSTGEIYSFTAKYASTQEKVNCCFQPLFSSFLPVFKKNSCYVPVLSSLPDSSCNNCFQNSYTLAVI